MDSTARGLHDVERWTNSNKLPLNQYKTKTLLVTGKRLQVPPQSLSVASSDGNKLEQVDSVRLLGIDIDSKLSFLDYVDRMCKKISQRIGVLNKIKSCLPITQRLLYYNAMIKPLFNYVDVAWVALCSKDSLSRVLKLQKLAGRMILNAEPRASSVHIFIKLKWLPFYNETAISKCSILFKRIQHMVPQYLLESLKLNSSLHGRTTRIAGLNFVTPRYIRKTEGGRTFTVTSIEKWNSLPVNIKKQATLKSFKRALRDKFLQEQQLLSHFNP